MSLKLTTRARPGMDYVCECGHSRAAHYKPGNECCDPGCCVSYVERVDDEPVASQADPAMSGDLVAKP